MSKIECEVEYSTDYNDENRELDCVVVTCNACGHSTSSWGHSSASVKRCLVLLSEECPSGENNFYVEE